MFILTICLALYIIKPYRFLVISAVGKMIAIEYKYYNKSELDELIAKKNAGML